MTVRAVLWDWLACASPTTITSVQAAFRSPWTSPISPRRRFWQKHDAGASYQTQCTVHGHCSRQECFETVMTSWFPNLVSPCQVEGSSRSGGEHQIDVKIRDQPEASQDLSQNSRTRKSQCLAVLHHNQDWVQTMD